MKRTSFLSPVKDTLEAPRSEYRIGSQVFPSPRSGLSMAPITKEGVVTLRPELEQHCLQLEKLNQQLKLKLTQLKTELHAKNLLVVKLESDLLIRQGRNAVKEHGSSVLAIEHQLLKEQLGQANKQIARQRVELQELQGKLSLENRGTTTRLGQLELEREQQTQELLAQQSQTESAARENKRLVGLVGKGKQEEKRLQAMLQEKTTEVQLFLEKLESDRELLDQLHEQAKLSREIHSSVTSAVEIWAREYDDYVNHGMISI